MSAHRLGDFFGNRQEAGKQGLPVMSVTMNDSLVLRDDLDRRLESTLRADQHLLVRKGDIAYNMMRMWQGACGLANADGIVSPAYVVLEPKSGINPRFAYHWFKSSRMIYLFWAYSHGLTEDRLRLYYDAFAEIPVSVPNLDQQARIVNILDPWDEATKQSQLLVTACRKRRASLLSKLYGPPKVALNTVLPPQWKRARVGELCSFTSGLWSGNVEPLERIGVVRNTNFDDDGTLDNSDVAFLDVESNQLKSRRLQVGDIILEKSGGGPDQPVGRPASFQWRDGVYSFSNFTSALRILEPTTVLSKYLHGFLHWVYLSGLTEVMQTRSTGIRNLDLDAYRDILVPIAPMEQQQRIVSILEAEHAAIIGHKNARRRLQAQKASLGTLLFEGTWDLGEQFALQQHPNVFPVADGRI